MWAEAMSYRLVIGNKNTSSWSLRPWLAMRHAGIAFREININLRAADAKAQILDHSPSGKVPALIVDDPAADGFVVWDTLAIIEYLAEAHPGASLWPDDRRARAVARAVSAEMHSGFRELREHCPMDLLARTPRDALAGRVADRRAAHRGHLAGLPAPVRRARARILFGAFTAADAMYAPVASRFRTYIPDLARLWRRRHCCRLRRDGIRAPCSA